MVSSVTALGVLSQGNLSSGRRSFGTNMRQVLWQTTQCWIMPLHKRRALHMHPVSHWQCTTRDDGRQRRATVSPSVPFALVDHVEQRLASREAAAVLQEQLFPLLAVGCAVDRHVRRDQHVRHRPERALGRQRLRGDWARRPAPAEPAPVRRAARSTTVTTTPPRLMLMKYAHPASCAQTARR